VAHHTTRQTFGRRARSVTPADQTNCEESRVERGEKLGELRSRSRHRTQGQERRVLHTAGNLRVSRHLIRPRRLRSGRRRLVDTSNEALHNPRRRTNARMARPSLDESSVLKHPTLRATIPTTRERDRASTNLDGAMDERTMERRSDCVDTTQQAAIRKTRWNKMEDTPADRYLARCDG